MANPSNATNYNEPSKPPLAIATVTSHVFDSHRISNKSPSEDDKQTKPTKPILVSNDSKSADDGDSNDDSVEITGHHLEATSFPNAPPSNGYTDSELIDTPTPYQEASSSEISDPETPEPKTAAAASNNNPSIYAVPILPHIPEQKDVNDQSPIISSGNPTNRASRSGSSTSNSSYGSTLNSIDTSDTTSSRSTEIPASWNSIPQQSDAASNDSSWIPPSWNSRDGQSRRNSVLSAVREQDEAAEDEKDDQKTDRLSNNQAHQPMVNQVLTTDALDAHNRHYDDIFDLTPLWLSKIATPSDDDSDTNINGQQTVHSHSVQPRNRTSSVSTDHPPSWNSISSNDPILGIINNGGRATRSRRNSVQSVSTNASLNSYGSNESFAARSAMPNMTSPSLQPIDEDDESKEISMIHVMSTIQGPSRPGTAQNSPSLGSSSGAVVMGVVVSGNSMESPSSSVYNSGQNEPASNDEDGDEDEMVIVD